MLKHISELTDEQILRYDYKRAYENVKTGTWKLREFTRWYKALEKAAKEGKNEN
jgi:hypothetical protein